MSKERQITTGGGDYLERSAKVLTAAFLHDPVFNWLLQCRSHEELKPALLRLLRGFLTNCSLNNATFIEIDNFAAVSVLMLPGTSLVSPLTAIRAGIIPAFFTVGVWPFKRAIFEYEPAAHALLPKALTKEEQKSYWYVFIMCTAEDRRREGLAAQLLAYMQDKARGDGRPLWLEATTPMSRDLYAKQGFELVGEIHLGQGVVGPDGVQKKIGEGITVWGMVWRPV